MTFKDRLNDLIEDQYKGSQKKLAEASGIACTTINCWLTRTANPTCSQLIKLADTFNVSLDYLTGRSDDNGTQIATAYDPSEYSRFTSLLRRMNTRQLDITFGFMCALVNNAV